MNVWQNRRLEIWFETMRRLHHVSHGAQDPRAKIQDGPNTTKLSFQTLVKMCNFIKINSGRGGVQPLISAWLTERTKLTGEFLIRRVAEVKLLQNITNACKASMCSMKAGS